MNINYAMKKILVIAIIAGLAGCGPSAQEKLAQQQLEQIEMQKKLQAAFEAQSKKAMAELEAHPLVQEKQVYKKFNLYPPKK